MQYTDIEVGRILAKLKKEKAKLAPGDRLIRKALASLKGMRREQRDAERDFWKGTLGPADGAAAGTEGGGWLSSVVSWFGGGASSSQT